MGGHAFLAPSAAGVWVNCSFAPTMAAQFPKPDTPESKRGEAAHWVIAECLESWARPADGKNSLLSGFFIGKTAPNGVVIDEDIAQGASVFITEALNICNRHGALQAMSVEKRVFMPSVHPLNDGTPDLFIPAFMEKTLYVMDYKHGMREVNAFECWQLMNYAEGVGQLLRDRGVIEQDWRVILVIVQPNCYTSGGAVDTWVTSFNEMRPYINRLAAKAHEAVSNPQACGGVWCRDCPGAAPGRCPGAARTAYEIMDHVTQPPLVHEMPDDELALYFRHLSDAAKLLKGLTAAAEDHIAHRIKSGARVEGLALAAAKGREVWAEHASHAQVVALCKMFDVDADAKTLRTPKQVIDAARADVRDPLVKSIAGLTTQNVNGLKIVKAGETNAARVYGKRE